jgi:hypothetical protein
MEQKTVLLATLWTYDLATSAYRESGVTSIFRDRLAQMSGKTPRELITEMKVRVNLINTLVERNATDMTVVTDFCRRYARNADAAIASLGVTKEDLLHRG